MRYRTWNRIRAVVGGYFWRPCPCCFRFFGGHEWADGGGHNGSIPDPDAPDSAGFRSVTICPDCIAAGVGCAAHAAHPDRAQITHDCNATRYALLAADTPAARERLAMLDTIRSTGQPW